MSNVVELTVRRPAVLRLDDGKEYELLYPLAAVIALEEKLGRSMRNSLDWLKITPAELPALIEIGLYDSLGVFEKRRGGDTGSYAEDEAANVAEKITDALSAEAVETVIEGLCWAAFPRAMKAYAEAIENARVAAAAGMEYAPGNVQSAVAS